MKRQRMCVTDVCLVGFRKTAVKAKEDVNTRVERLTQCSCWPDESQQFYENVNMLHFQSAPPVK